MKKKLELKEQTAEPVATIALPAKPEPLHINFFTETHTYTISIPKQQLGLVAQQLQDALRSYGIESTLTETEKDAGL